MSLFLDLVADNFHILFILCGFAYFLISQKDTPASVEKKYYWWMFACSIVLLIVVPLELWTARDISRYNLRVLFSVIAYWVRPAAVMFLVFSCTPKSKMRILIALPEILNIICMSAAFFGDYAFYYDHVTYKFIRLPLGYAPHIAAGIYVVWLIAIMIREVTKGFKLESGILFICVFFSTVGLLYTMFTGYEFVSFSITTSGFFHYMFIRATKHYSEMAKQIEDLEKAKQAADTANATKTKFLLNMSHDIRTPMNAIIGFSEILRNNPDDPEKIENYTKKLQISGNYLLSLINEMLEMARIESGKMLLNENAVCIDDIVESIDSIFTPQANDKGIALSPIMNIQHKYIFCDATKVFEVFFNLISNSIKYTKSGGEIKVYVDEFYKENEPSTYFRIVVSDTGMGISEEFLPYVFEEFSREKTTTEGKIAGTGLGMPIVKKLVDLMGGTIGIESKINVGTKITVHLPIRLASKEDLVDQSTEVITEKTFDRPVNILLVEDNDFNAEVAMTLLDGENYNIKRASNGAECLDMVKESLNPDADSFDIIFMDIQMPVLNGYETTKELRNFEDSRVNKLPIIAMTADAFEEDKQKALAAGMNDHISKPIDVEKIKKAINKYVV